ncbi:PD-(D/E)XK nuclease family protein [Halovenus amylolytica]|uniref:PD-(D/E)XK nuclease family protein n=1 Tax=Halovenus amylolytica TaxID=2500550 RepID=UPI00362380A4
MTDSLSDQLAGLKSALDGLPEAKEPPSTTLQIIRNNQQEEEWQQLLFHYLSQDEPHGLDHSFLEHILSALSNRDDLDFTFSGLDLADVQVKQEVTIPNGRRPDAVVWTSEEWFICWELKIKASEREDQTQDYADAESFESINLTKKDVPDSGQHYVYLAPKDTSPPEAEEFVHVWWRWIAEQIQTFLNEGHGGYPSRTTAQLEQFIGTIKSEVTMTDYQKYQQEKAQLCFDYYNEIQEVQRAFENQWNEFTDNWGLRLAQALENAEIVEIPELSDTHVAVELWTQTDEPSRWTFRQGNSWAGIAKEEWRRRTDDHTVVYWDLDHDEYANIGFYHLLEKNREEAIKDEILDLTLFHGSSSDRQFHKLVNERVNNKIDEREYELPSYVNRPNNSAVRIVSATYDIPVSKYDTFFEAYTEALRYALADLTGENRELITIITESFEESLEEYY